MVLESVEVVPQNPESEPVDLAKEKQAHEFRSAKRVDSPDSRAFLTVIRSDEGIWERIQPSPDQQRQLDKKTALPGETHRISASLFANIYRDPEAAALYDISLFRATQEESDYFKDRIRKGGNYSPVIVIGAGGVYGTIFSAASLKENPNNPPFGFDGGERRGGLWTISGDLVLDKPWWRMNSRNRPEDRTKLPLPGSEGNLNSLGAEAQNLQVPDISSAQYPTNNELGRVLAHDNFLSNNIAVDSKLVKVRLNKQKNQKGQFEQEYEDTKTGERFFVYTDTLVQATGLGDEDLGFSDKFSSTRAVLEGVEEDLKAGIRTPKLLTFLQLVRATTSNRNVSSEFDRFGLIGKGDTSKVIREYFAGIGGIDPGIPAQLGFVKEIAIFGLGEETAEKISQSERARYFLQLLEFQRQRGGFFRFRPVDGRVVGVGLPESGEGLRVYFRRTDQTPEGPIVTIGNEIVPRLVTSAGFEDKSNMVYSGLTAEILKGEQEIKRRFDEAITKAGSTIYYKDNTRVDINGTTDDRSMVDITIIGTDGKTARRMIDRENVVTENVDRIEIAGQPPEFKPFFDKDYDDEVPIAEKAEGFEIYKIGACSNLPITDKERKQTAAYEQIPENTKSIFRFVRRTVAFAAKLASQTKAVPGALNLERYKSETKVLLNPQDSGDRRDLIEFLVDPKANAQKLPQTVNGDRLLQYLTLSDLRCIFPQGFDKLKFGIKRVPNPQPEDASPYSFAIALDPPLPQTGGWELVEGFLKDQLTQRLLVQLTRNPGNTAEIVIGIKRGMVDIKNTSGKSIKLTEVKDFNQRYQGLAE